MVVLKPTLEGEVRKTCARCPIVGIGSPVLERTTFYRGSRGGYRGLCRWCEQEDRRVRRLENPDREGNRRRQARYEEKHRQERNRADRERRQARIEADPVGERKKAADAQRKYQKKIRNDPEKRRTRNANAQIARRLRQEKAGRALSIAKAPKKPDRHDSHNRRLPVAPFRAVIVEFEREAAAMGFSESLTHVALLMGTTRKTLRFYLEESETITEKSADRFLSHDGRRSLFDLWPQGAETVYRPSGREERLVRASERCADPGCGEPSSDGRFCHEHAERLARIRGELETDAALMASNGGADRKHSKARRAKTPTCTSLDCWESRIPPSAFCPACEQKGCMENPDEMLEGER